MLTALLRTTGTALRRARIRREITHIERQIGAACADIESHQQALRLATLPPAARRAHREQLHRLMGTELPRLSLQLSNLRLALRNGLPPATIAPAAMPPACKPVLAQVQPAPASLPSNIAVLRRRERTA
jgi:hypothetical protein